MSRVLKKRRLLVVTAIILLPFVLLYYFLFGFHMPKYLDPLMNMRVNDLSSVGIRPHQWYYEPEPSSSDSLLNLLGVGNFPESIPPATLAESENINLFYDTISIMEFQVGENYQYSRFRYRHYDRTYSLLNEEQLAFFKPLENGVHYVVLANDGLILLNGVEEAVKQPAYLRVTKDLGRVTLVDKRILKVAGETWIEYWPNGNEKRTVIHGYGIDGSVIDTKEVLFEEKDGSLKSRIAKYPNYYLETQRLSDDKAWVTNIYINDVHVHHILTHHLKDEIKIINETLNAAGEVIATSDRDEKLPYPQFDEPEIYKAIPRDESRYQKIRHLRSNHQLMDEFLRSGAKL